MFYHRIIKPASLVLLLAVVLYSCKVGQQYKRPDLELPQQYRGQQQFADTSSIASIEWKQFFTDPALLQLIDKGLSNNHDLLIAVKRIDIAQQQVRQAKTLWYPELDLQIGATYNHPSKNSLNGLSTNTFLGKSYIENYLAVVSLSWEIDIWGKISRQKETALAAYLQSNEAAKAVQTRLVAGIAQGYYNLLMLDRQKQITERNIMLRDSFLVATRLLRDAGNTTSLAVQQAEAQKQEAQLLLPELEQLITVQENALSVLTGQLPGPINRNASLDSYTPPASLSTGVPVAMVSRRPDVRADEFALVIANAQAGIAQANMYPALNISAGGGLESFKSSNWFNIPGSLFGVAAGTVAQPIFRRRALKTAYETAKLEREQAVIKFRQSVLQATGEVSTALVQAEKLAERQVIAQMQMDTLNRAVANAQLLFKSDMANYLEVINAQSNALQAELNLAFIRREQVNAVIELYRSLGGGWN